MSCNEAGYDSRLGNNEIKPPKQIGLNGATKNRTLQYPNPPNLIKQRTAANVGMVIGFTWNKEEQGADTDFKPGSTDTTEENSAMAGIQTGLVSATKVLLTATWFD